MHDNLRMFSTGTAETFPGFFAQDQCLIGPMVLPWDPLRTPR